MHSNSPIFLLQALVSKASQAMPTNAVSESTDVGWGSEFPQVMLTLQVPSPQSTELTEQEEVERKLV